MDVDPLAEEWWTPAAPLYYWNDLSFGFLVIAAVLGGIGPGGRTQVLVQTISGTEGGS